VVVTAISLIDDHDAPPSTVDAKPSYGGIGDRDRLQRRAAFCAVCVDCATWLADDVFDAIDRIRLVDDGSALTQSSMAIDVCGEANMDVSTAETARVPIRARVAVDSSCRRCCPIRRLELAIEPRGCRCHRLRAVCVQPASKTSITTSAPPSLWIVTTSCCDGESFVSPRRCLDHLRVRARDEHDCSSARIHYPSKILR